MVSLSRCMLQFVREPLLVKSVMQLTLQPYLLCKAACYCDVCIVTWIIYIHLTLMGILKSCKLIFVGLVTLSFCLQDVFFIQQSCMGGLAVKEIVVYLGKTYVLIPTVFVIMQHCFHARVTHWYIFQAQSYDHLCLNQRLIYGL